MKSLHVLFQHGPDQLPFGCSMVRLLRPLGYHEQSRWQITYGTDLPDHRVDVVIIERLWKPDTGVEQAHALIKHLKAAGSKIVYTLDDDLLALDMPAARLNAVRLFAREADGIIVSTGPLMERMRRLNQNTVLLPNQIDDQLFGPPRPPKSPEPTVTMGYMGTYTHLPDLLSILAPLRRCLRHHKGRLKLELVGVSENPEILGLFEGLPVSLKKADGHVAYDRFVPWMKRELKWDFAIAPLLNSRFNLGKSDLKYLDYGALSIPGIYSAMRPYLDTVEHGRTGLIAHNNEDWEKHIDSLVTDITLRESLACAARDQIYQERCLRVHASAWLETIETLISTTAH